jgi:hypothetical protein
LPANTTTKIPITGIKKVEAGHNGPLSRGTKNCKSSNETETMITTLFLAAMP